MNTLVRYHIHVLIKAKYFTRAFTCFSRYSIGCHIVLQRSFTTFIGGHSLFSLRRWWLSLLSAWITLTIHDWRRLRVYLTHQSILLGLAWWCFKLMINSILVHYWIAVRTFFVIVTEESSNSKVFRRGWRYIGVHKTHVNILDYWFLFGWLSSEMIKEAITASCTCCNFFILFLTS